MSLMQTSTNGGFEFSSSGKVSTVNSLVFNLSDLLLCMYICISLEIHGFILHVVLYGQWKGFPFFSFLDIIDI